MPQKAIKKVMSGSQDKRIYTLQKQHRLLVPQARKKYLAEQQKNAYEILLVYHLIQRDSAWKNDAAWTTYSYNIQKDYT